MVARPPYPHGTFDSDFVHPRTRLAAEKRAEIRQWAVKMAMQNTVPGINTPAQYAKLIRDAAKILEDYVTEET